LAELDIRIFQLSDTIGVAQPPSIAYLFGELIPAYPELEIGAHFHTTPSSWQEKISTAYEHGCRRFDGAIRGYGGCPMAKDELTGNMPMEHLVYHFAELDVPTGVNTEIFGQAYQMAATVFPAH
jgi:hydroxymethylglutaryl-CoA lyase